MVGDLKKQISDNVAKQYFSVNSFHLRDHSELFKQTEI